MSTPRRGGRGGHLPPATASDTRHIMMEGDDDVAPDEVTLIASRSRKRQQCNVDKRRRMGHDAYKQERSAARKTQRAAARQREAERAQQQSAQEMNTAWTGASIPTGDPPSVPLPTAYAYATPLPAAPVIDVAGQLERLAALYFKGFLDDHEFSTAKSAAIAASKPPQPHSSSRRIAASKGFRYVHK